jgi:hypothetical protein
MTERRDAVLRNVGPDKYRFEIRLKQLLVNYRLWCICVIYA